MQRTDFLQPTADENDDDLADFTLGVLTAPPGGGKSTAFLHEAASVPGLYLIAAQRIALADEHAERMRRLVAHLDPQARPTIVVVHSDQPDKGEVDRRVCAALDAYAGTHAVVITTHAALMALAPEDVAGCHVRIDEAPETGVLSGVVGLAASWPTMAMRYDLVPGPEAGWFRLIRRRGVEALRAPQIRGDVGGGLVEVHRLARSRGRIVEVDLAAWEDAGVPGRAPVRWRSIWSLSILRDAASVQIAAAGYDRSLIGHATARAGGVRAVPIPVGQPRTGQPQIRVHYYVAAHTGSTTWWATREGGTCLFAVARHLEGIGFRGYFATNKPTKPFFFGLHRAAEEISPRNAGTNSLRHHTDCAILYSCKATDADEALIAALGIDRNDIRTAREDEDIFQTATRGTIRDPAYAGGYDVHVYDLGQAERLSSRLDAVGYADITLVAEDGVGVMDVPRPGSARGGRASASVVVETAAERRTRRLAKDAERKRLARERATEAKKATGLPWRRGRPRRSA